MQLTRTAAESTRVLGQPTPPVLSGTSPLVNPLTPQMNAAAALPSPTPLPVAPSPNPLLQSYQQILNPAFLELQRQLIAQQTAQFRLPLLPTQMTSSMSLPSLRQIPPTLPHVSPIPTSPASLPARPVPRKPAPVVVTPNISPTTPTTSTPRSDGSFAVPQDPVMRKPSIPLNTSADERDKANRPKSPEFEMGKLPVKNYVPSHFMKGTMIQMASGKLKKVEEMSSDDFLLAAPLTREFNVDASVVEGIARGSTLARVKFAVGQTRYEAILEPQLEHPFFVLGKGWCSCDPHRTAETYGLECQELKVGDVCISLSRKSDSDAKQLDETVTLTEAAEVKEKEAAQAAIREELSKEMDESNGRNSAPPTRYHPYSKKLRKVSES
ncbi:unnamed protein product [Cylicostephanus goldi]|uniref:AXH domain-containing protein n=1 Tax=Cylicostephanus goldi TaxID=71465 RepID=A0A3P6QQY0_CYLGO|nr:unnamed protein product [Cylicostephanus goldi]